MPTETKPTGERGCQYIRVSTDTQPIERQIDQARNWLSGFGLTVSKLYIDDEGSNRRHKAETREAFQKLLADVSSGYWQWCVIDSLDRLGFKHDFEKGSFLNIFLEGGCQLWDVARGTLLTDPYNPATVFQTTANSITSAEEQREKSRRVLSGKMVKARDGRYPGGNIPFGFDVAICDKQGQEQWRVIVVHAEKQERTVIRHGQAKKIRKRLTRYVKRYPDGREEIIEGENCFPKYDDWFDPRYVVSQVPGRAEALKQVFHWYATEDVSFCEIAKRLNRASIRPYYGPLWHPRMVQDLLRNPIVRGTPAFGKEQSGDFYTYTEGKVHPVKWEKNRPVHDQKKRDAKDWITPHGYRLPELVTEQTWNDVQVKLDSTKGRPRPSSNDNLWLKPFLVCVRCNRGMRGTAPKTGRSEPHYYCATYFESYQTGQSCTTGCLRHPAPHAQLEEIVNRYLTEKGTEYATLAEAEIDPNALNGLLDELATNKAEEINTVSRMAKFVEFAAKENGVPVPGQTVSELTHTGKLGAVVKLYQEFARQERDGVISRLSDLNRQLEDAVTAFARLKSPKAVEIANQKIADLESQIADLESKAEPLSERLDGLYTEVQRIKEALNGARQAMKGSNNRRKAEALARIVNRIELHFHHTGGRGRQSASVLEKVEIVPKVGDSSTYAVSHLDRRTYATQKTRNPSMTDLLEEIATLKRREDAAILAHYYQDSDLQELADFTGDSLKLARAATKVMNRTIVFCGVHFMAETAKILNPEKRVLLPDVEAGCSLADSCPAGKLARYQEMLRENGRRFQTVTYINSTAAVKALSDWIVTSGNAEEIIRRVPAEYEILFAPDRHLGQYLQEVTGRKMILWNGACMVHEIFSVGDLLERKRQLPGALVIAHPECPANVREHSDFVGGTEAMLKYIAGFAQPTDFLVATEANMMWQMQHKFPRHRYHPVPGITCACNKCPHMARNTLEKLRDCLARGTPEIGWQPEFDRAKSVLERSLLN